MWKSRTFKKRAQQNGFTKVGEGAKIPAGNTPQFERMGYEIEKYSGYYPVTNELLEDSDANIADALTNGELDMVINTPHGKESAHDDSYIRKTAIKMKIPYMTNIAAANAAVEGILEAEIHGTHEVKSLQEYHKAIKD